MKKVCEFFSLEEEVECLDEGNTKYIIPASPEVKGIRGSDKKKFLLDLLRLSPRDANWIGDDNEYLCCVIRLELISHYVTSKNFHIAAEAVRKEFEEQRRLKHIESIKEEIKELPDAKEKDDTVDSKDTSDTQDTKDSFQSEKKITYSEYMHKVQEFMLKRGNIYRPKFNPNLYTRVQLVESANIEE